MKNYMLVKVEFRPMPYLIQEVDGYSVASFRNEKDAVEFLRRKRKENQNDTNR